MDILKRFTGILLLMVLAACGSRELEVSPGYQFGHYYVAEVNITEKEKGHVKDFDRLAPIIKNEIQEYLKPSAKTPPEAILNVEMAYIKVEDTRKPVIDGYITLIDAKTHQVIGARDVYYSYKNEKEQPTPYTGGAGGFGGGLLAGVMTAGLNAAFADKVPESTAINEFSYEIIRTLYPGE